MQDIKDRVEEALDEIWMGIFVAPEYRPILAKLIKELTEREAKLVEALKAAQELLTWTTDRLIEVANNEEEKSDPLLVLFDALVDGRFASYRDQFQAAIAKAEGK